MDLLSALLGRSTTRAAPESDEQPDVAKGSDGDDEGATGRPDGDSAGTITYAETGNHATEADDLPEFSDGKAGATGGTGHDSAKMEDEPESTEAKASSGSTDSVPNFIPKVEALFSLFKDKDEENLREITQDKDTDAAGPDSDADKKGSKDSPTDKTIAGADGMAMWSNWKPTSERQLDRPVKERKSSGKDWDWTWEHYIGIKDSTVRVELSGMQVTDKDLESLFRHLDQLLKDCAEQYGKDGMNHDIDLSCNDNVTDAGVAKHLAPHLERFPACSRLKLYKTAIGDKALESLGPWISKGYAHELHLSDLRGEVSGEAVYRLLKQVQKGGNYPYRHGEKVQCPLWLRLEYNGIRNPEQIVARGKAEQMSLWVVEKNDLQHCRPGTNEVKKGFKNVPAVHLVMFQAQGIRHPKLRKGSRSVEDEEPWNPGGPSKGDESSWKVDDASRKADDKKWKADDVSWKAKADDLNWKAADSKRRGDDSSWRSAEASWWADEAGWMSNDSKWQADTGQYDKVKGRGGAEGKGRGENKSWNEDGAWTGKYEQSPLLKEPQQFGQGAEPTSFASSPIRSAQLTTACDLLEAIDYRVREGDLEVFDRWRRHVENAEEPQVEAGRIAKMVGKLCAQGYNSNGSYGGSHAVTPVTTPTSQSMPARSPSDFILPIELPSASEGSVLLGLLQTTTASSSTAPYPGPDGDDADNAANKKKKGKNKIKPAAAPEAVALSSAATFANGDEDLIQEFVTTGEPPNAESGVAVVPEAIAKLPTHISDCAGSAGDAEVCAAEVGGGGGTATNAEGLVDKPATLPGDSGALANDSAAGED